MENLNEDGKLEYIRNRFAELKAQLENTLGRDVSFREIYEATRIAQSTLSNLYHNKSDASPDGTVSKLLSFFREYGVECSIETFFYETGKKRPLDKRLENTAVLAAVHAG